MLKRCFCFSFLSDTKHDLRFPPISLRFTEMNVVRVQHIKGIKNCQRHLLSHISLSVMVKNTRKWSGLKTTRFIM